MVEQVVAAHDPCPRDLVIGNGHAVRAGAERRIPRRIAERILVRIRLAAFRGAGRGHRRDAREQRLLLEHGRQIARVRVLHADIAEGFGRARAAVLQEQIEERGVARARVPVDARHQLFAPLSLASGAQVQTSGERGGRGRGVFLHAHDDSLIAAVRKELLHRIAECAVGPQRAIQTREIGIARDEHGLIGRAAQRATDKRGDRSGDAGDGMDIARPFVDIDAGIR